MTFQWDGGSVKRSLVKVADAALLEQADALRDHVVENELSGQSLNVRTGQLRRSINRKKIGELHYRVGTNMPYAQIHEYGGTIRPTRAKFLTFAVGFALTARGVPKAAYKNGPGAIPDSDLVWIPRRKGGWVVLHKRGKTKRSHKLVFVLVPSVEIKGKHYMEKSFRNRVPKIEAVLAEAISGALSDNGGAS